LSIRNWLRSNQRFARGALFLFGPSVALPASAQKLFCRGRILFTRSRSQTVQYGGRMSVVALFLLSLLVGWLATLTLQSDIDNLFARDFTIAALGAGLTAVLAGRYLGIALTGEFGLTLSGVTVMWVGALVLLSATNFMRHGHPMCRRARSA
jgi:hypothetical protein